MPRDSRGDRRARRVSGMLTARRIAWPAALWGTVFGGYIAYAALQYATTYPTAASREKVALTFGANAGLTALLGQGQQLATVAGFTAWRAMGVLVPVGAVWAMLTATRLTRGEEEAGRTELLLAGQTTRRRAAAQAMAGLNAGLALLWAITAIAAVIAGSSPKVSIPAGGALFLATAVTAGPVMFAAAGVLAGQLTPSRRQANGITAVILGTSLLIRIVADSSPGLHWLRWLSPLGWAEQLHPLTGPAPIAFLPIAAFTTVLAAGAITLAARRDIGAGAFPSHDTPRSRTRLLRGPAGLAWRLGRPAITGWAAGLATLGLIGGLVAPSAAKAISDSAAIRQVIARLGAQPGSAAYLGIIYLIGAVLTCFAAASQITTTRSEEADGYADHLLARPVSRRRWLAGRLAIAAALVVIASLAAGLAGLGRPRRPAHRPQLHPARQGRDQHRPARPVRPGRRQPRLRCLAAPRPRRRLRTSRLVVPHRTHRHSDHQPVAAGHLSPPPHPAGPRRPARLDHSRLADRPGNPRRPGRHRLLQPPRPCRRMTSVNACHERRGEREPAPNTFAQYVSGYTGLRPAGGSSRWASEYSGPARDCASGSLSPGWLSIRCWPNLLPEVAPAAGPSSEVRWRG